MTGWKPSTNQGRIRDLCFGHLFLFPGILVAYICFSAVGEN
jgi:hypothetical protein